MLELIAQVEKELPDLLKDKSQWNSLFVDYEHPFVERLWRPWGDYRIYLHKIHPCRPEEALFHPHPWPSVVKIVDGKYQMGLGHGSGKTPPEITATTILTPDSEYEMSHIDGWHYVAPINNFVYSLMITGKPWDRWSPKNITPLKSLAKDQEADLFSFFKSRYSKTRQRWLEFG